MANKGRELYEFGPFQLDPAKRILLRDRKPVPLQLKAFEILLVLVRNGDQVVLKEDLLQAVWPDTFVEEGNLTQNIFVLRKTLSAGNGDARYIETIPGRGYRLTTQVRVIPGELNSAAPDVLTDTSSKGTAAETDLRRRRITDGAASKPAPLSGKRLLLTSVLCLAALVVAFAIFRPFVPPPRVTRISQLTHLGTLVHNTRLLTDGPRIYFRVWQGKDRVVRSVSTEGGEVFPVENSLATFDIDDISPDGSEFLETDLTDTARAANSQGIYGSLWRVPVPSGSPRPVGKLQSAEASWSPDGQSIAYSFASGLYRAGVDGSDARKVAALPDDPFYFAWSPDRKRLRFTAADSAHSGYSIWQADFSTNKVNPWIQDSPQAARPWAGGWTPDDRYFFYTAVSEGNRNLWAIREKAELLRRVNPQPTQLTNGPLTFYVALPGKDGKRVFAVGEQSRGELMRYDSASKQFSAFANGLSADDIAYSLDGQWMAYVDIPEGTLVRSRSDGTERRQLTFPPMRAFNPRWSPDGTHIAFEASPQFGAPHKIYLISSDGGTPELATAPSEDSQAYPSWFAAGESILYSSSDASESLLELHVVDLKTHGVSVVPSSAGLQWGQISPDGLSIAAVRKPSNELVLYDTASRTVRTLGRIAAYPHWSSNGKALYFSSPYFDVTGINGGVYRMDLATNSTTTLAQYPEFLLTGAFGVSYAITPDGSVLLLRDITTRDLYVIDLDLP